MPKKNIVKRLRRALNAAGVTQSELSRYCGVSRQTVSLWVHPDPDRSSLPSDDQLEVIAQRLGVTVSWLVGTSTSGGPVERDSKLRTSRAHNGRQDRFVRAARELVNNAEPARVPHWLRTLQPLGVEDAWRFEYASSDLLADIVAAEQPDPVTLRYRLWRLAVMRAIDIEVGVERCYAVLTAATGIEGVKREAQLLDLELHTTRTPEDVAAFILKN